MNQDHINSEWTQDLPHSFGGKYRSYDYYKNVNNKIIDNQFKRVRELPGDTYAEQRKLALQKKVRDEDPRNKKRVNMT